MKLDPEIQAMQTVRSGVGRPRAAEPPITIPKGLLPSQRRIALATILLPTAGAALAVAQLVTLGVSRLELLLLTAFFVLTNLGIEFGFHRNIGHRAFEAHRAVRLFFAVMGSMAAQGRLLYWVASHRRHHIHSDSIHDPHSPHVRTVGGRTEERLQGVRGWWHSHVKHMLDDDVTNCTLFAKDVVKDEMLMFINRHYLSLVVAGILLPGAIGFAATTTLRGLLGGILWGGLVRMFLVHHTTWSVASFAHIFGSRPFQTGDRSANNWLVSIPSFGSGLQNNHHAFPYSAYIGLRWYEIDLTAWVIRALSWLNLVWDVRKPTRLQIQAKR